MHSTETDKSVTLYAVVELRNATEDHLALVRNGLQHRGFDILPDELQHRAELRASSLYVTGTAECFEQLTGVELTLTTRKINERLQAAGEVRRIETEIAVCISPQLITEINGVDHLSQHIASIHFEPRLDPTTLAQ